MTVDQRRSDAIVAASSAPDGVWHKALIAFLRVVALGYVLISMRDWALALGLMDDALRYDRAGTAWAIYHTIVCVLHPIVAIGLWTTLAWGRVVWFASIAVQLAAMTLYRETYGLDFPLAVFILGTLVTYAILAFGNWLNRKEG